MNADKATIEVADWSKLPADPLVSVYMLAYRHEKFIAEAIEGVIAQRCDFPIELIIGEDCSPDRTFEIVRAYQKRYPNLIRILTANHNVGAHSNARRCQLATRGKFIAICEGDDFWHHPRKLQMQADMMSADSAKVFCHTDFDRKTRFRTRRARHRSHPSPWLAEGDAYVPLLHEWSVVTATTMTRSDVFAAFRGSEFDNPEWPFGDGNRMLFASLRGTVGYIDESTTTFRKVRGSATNSTNASHLQMRLAVEGCIAAFLARHPVDCAAELAIRIILKSKIYHAAFYAERPDLMQTSHDWLKDNGADPGAIAHRARLLAIKTKLPFKILRATKNFIDLRLSANPA